MGLGKRTWKRIGKGMGKRTGKGTLNETSIKMPRKIRLYFY